MNKMLIIIAGISGCIVQDFSCSAQETVNVSGGIIKNNKVSLGYSVGNPIAGAHGNGPFLVQGIQQPSFDISTIYKYTKLEFDISVYPNPTTHDVNLRIKGNALKCQLSIIDEQGKTLSDKSMTIGTDAVILKMTDFPKGIYFLRVASPEGLVYETYKVVKIK